MIMSKCLEEANIPDWMIKGKIILIQKELQKGTLPPSNIDQ